MAIYKKLTGNYANVIQSLFPEGFQRIDPNPLTTVQRDIPRTPLFQFKQKIGHFQMIWNQFDKPEFYSQGIMDAGFFKNIYYAFIQRTNSGDDYWNGENIGSIRFAFFDDNNTPCAFSITYSKIEPTLWTAAIIRNTIEEPINRQVTVIGREDMINVNAISVSNMHPESDLLNEVNSVALKEMLASMFLNNGQISHTRVDLLAAQIGTIHSNMLSELNQILRLMLISHQSDDACYWLILYLQAVSGSAVMLNQVTMNDLEIMKNNPAESPLLDQFKNQHVEPGFLDDIRALARAQSENELANKDLTLPFQSNINRLEQNMSSLISRKNAIRLFLGLIIVGAIVACFFFPPTLALIGMICAAVPALYEWRQTSLRITDVSAQQDIDDTHCLSLTNEISDKDNMDVLLLEKAEQLVKANQPRKSSVSTQSNETPVLNREIEADDEESLSISPASNKR